MDGHFASALNTTISLAQSDVGQRDVPYASTLNSILSPLI